MHHNFYNSIKNNKITMKVFQKNAAQNQYYIHQENHRKEYTSRFSEKKEIIIHNIKTFKSYRCIMLDIMNYKIIWTIMNVLICHMHSNGQIPFRFVYNFNNNQ